MQSAIIWFFKDIRSSLPILRHEVTVKNLATVMCPGKASLGDTL